MKCNYESWMVWDNLMVVSVDCGCFEEVSLLISITKIIIIIAYCNKNNFYYQRQSNAIIGY